MMLLRPLRFLAKALVVETTPRQLAWGFALGMVIGLVPKGNLIAVALMTVFCAVRINLAAGTAAIALFTSLGMLLDPLSHRLGHFLLTHPGLRAMWTSLYDAPIVPWTDFNNTVVLGSTLIGLALLYPVYAGLQPLFTRIEPAWKAKLQKYRVVHLLLGGELAGKLAAR